MKKFIINLCPTGVIPTKELNQYSAISSDEIATDVVSAYKKGIQMVHIHARDEEGNNTMNKYVYAEIISKIKVQCPDIIIVVSLTGRIDNTFESRSDVLNLKGLTKPDMGSLTLSSLNFNKSASINSPEMIVKLLEKMNQKKIKPELEVFDVGMINFSKYLIKKGLLQPPYYYNIILGNIFSAQTVLSDVTSLVNALPPDSLYSIRGIGSHQLTSNMLGVIYGDGVRVGLEDNIYYDNKRTELASNDKLIDRVISLSKINERELYTCSELRTILKLKKIGNHESQ